jgi:hypothetical protein
VQLRGLPELREGLKLLVLAGFVLSALERLLLHGEAAEAALLLAWACT